MSTDDANDPSDPSDEGGDPACWAHLFEDDEPAPLPAPGAGPGPGPGATVLQLSDIHLTGTPGELVQGADPTRRLLTVLERWRMTGATPDLVLLTGDNTDDGSVEAYRRLQEALAPLDAPVLAVAGNHDDLAHQQEVFGDTAVAEVGRWRVVGLTTAVPHQVHGTIDPDAVARQLDGLDDRPPVVALHHPPVSRSTHEWFRLDGGDGLLAALAERPHVRLLVSGHLHDAFELAGPGDLALLGAPSVLVAIGHDGDTFEVGVDAPAGARLLHLADTGSATSTLLEA
jgi:Icc protein